MRTHRRSRRRSRDDIIRRGCSNVSESGKKGWQNHCVFLFDSILFYIQYDLLRVFVLDFFEGNCYVRECVTTIDTILSGWDY